LGVGQEEWQKIGDLRAGPSTLIPEGRLASFLLAGSRSDPETARIGKAFRRAKIKATWYDAIGSFVESARRAGEPWPYQTAVYVFPADALRALRILKRIRPRLKDVWLCDYPVALKATRLGVRE
jgi:hypothetical protein